jgi:predicted transcriptional regulator
MAKPKPAPGSFSMYNMRFPTELKWRVEFLAKRSRRSTNAEILRALEAYCAQNGMSSLKAPLAAGAGVAPGDAEGEGSAG